MTGVIFFNNVAYLGMCGHGTIGVVATLAYLGRIGPGTHRIETPVGVVTARLDDDGAVEIANVPSYRLAANVSECSGFGPVIGDVAWGGNWFSRERPLIRTVTRSTRGVDRFHLARSRITRARGNHRLKDGQEIDHVELFGPSELSGVDSKNFVLCPGKAYDRSPCGTGTSAKLACLFADGKLAEGQVWRQESIVGSVFEGTVSIIDNTIHPHIKGSAFITAEAELILDVRDPFCMGIRG